MEKLMENWGSVIAPIIFFLFLAMHLLSRYLDRLKRYTFIVLSGYNEIEMRKHKYQRDNSRVLLALLDIWPGVRLSHLPPLDIGASFSFLKGSKSDDDLKLRQEIKRLLKEANALSGPSTFAQSAKLRRMAAAKEKELERMAKVNTKEANRSYNIYFTALRVLKVLIYVGSIWWFWGVPVAIIAQQQILPFGKVLSWRAGNNVAGHVTVGAVPWLMLTSRVSNLIAQKLLP